MRFLEGLPNCSIQHLFSLFILYLRITCLKQDIDSKFILGDYNFSLIPQTFDCLLYSRVVLSTGVNNYEQLTASALQKLVVNWRK